MALQPRMKIGTGRAPEHKFQRICYFRRGHSHISQCIPALGHNLGVLATCKPSHATTIAGSTKTQEESPSPQDSDYAFASCWCQGICWHSRRRGSRSFCLVARRSYPLCKWVANSLAPACDCCVMIKAVQNGIFKGCIPVYLV